MISARHAAASGHPRRRALSAILWGGFAAGVGDSLLALGLYSAPLTVIYQSIASGLMGRAAFRGGLATAALGCLLHFFIATTAAAVYVSVRPRLPLLARYVVAGGLAYGVAVYLFMKYVVLPLSAVVRRTPFDPAAMLGHALLVGLPIALIAARSGAGERRPAAAPAAAPQTGRD